MNFRWVQGNFKFHEFLTKDMENFPYTAFFSHPADYTPVCTTEIGTCHSQKARYLTPIHLAPPCSFFCCYSVSNGQKCHTRGPAGCAYSWFFGQRLRGDIQRFPARDSHYLPVALAKTARLFVPISVLRGKLSVSDRKYK